MAKSARQIVFEGMEIFLEGLIPFLETRLKNAFGDDWYREALNADNNLKLNKKGSPNWDNLSALKVTERKWNDAFRSVLGRQERSIVNELIEIRNKLAHDEKFTYDDTERALDNIRRFLSAISAGEQSEKVSAMRESVLRTKYAELQRNEERKKGKTLELNIGTTSGLKSWREVVRPHQDVASGKFTQAEFAADLAKVHNGSAPKEYLDPVEFYSRTYITDGLRDLLIRSAERITGKGGDPVIELQTNFGGGKTHSMLALYHMVGGTDTKKLPGLDQLIQEKKLALPENINKAVVVGTSRGPKDFNEQIKSNGGKKIFTTWGEIAWQLGGKKAYEIVEDADQSGIAPGSDLLEKLFKFCGPSLILIDEWVAYLRQIYKTSDLPSGTFDANITFVQSLTEAVKSSPGTLLVATLPASQIEVGGEGGEEALNRLKQTFSRVESSWRPASQIESYEIVRRRLFQEISGENARHKDNTIKQFMKMYRENRDDFPKECEGETYKTYLDKAYPIHPELFNQLYTVWGSIDRFQRTRGVLRFMAQVIHSLWTAEDPSVLIMPGSVPVGTSRVLSELNHYLTDNWQSIIAKDVDGEGSLPDSIDKQRPNLGRYSATRRVARSLFMGTAPLEDENKGLELKQVNLGVVQPGEIPSVFADALHHFSNQSTFLHSDFGRFWFSTKPSLNRLALDLAKQAEEDFVKQTIDQEISNYFRGLGDRGGFSGIHCVPNSSADIEDEKDGVRVVVLGVNAPFAKGQKNNSALAEAKDIILQKGKSPRVYRNTLVFLAGDSRLLENLSQAVRLSLAWNRIVKDTDRYDLTQSDSARAQEKSREAKDTLKARLKETWCYLIYPIQSSANDDLEWTTGKVRADDNILSALCKKLVNEEALITDMGPNRLNKDLENYLWGKNPHLRIKDLLEYLNKFLYLPRIQNRYVLTKTIQQAISQLDKGPFAYAEAYDEKTKGYKGLVIEAGGNVSVIIDSESLIVKSDVAEKNRPEPPKKDGEDDKPGAPKDEDKTEDDKPKDPTRYRGTVKISSERPARDLSKVVESVIENLASLDDSKIEIILDIEAEVPGGIKSDKVRVIRENAQTLKFIDNEFE